MKKFDLERALAGEPVMTRDGRVMDEILFSKFLKNKPVIGICRDSSLNFNLDGTYWDNRESDVDLFMVFKGKQEPKTIWINVWKHFKDGSIITTIHSRKDKCDKEIDELLSHTLIKTIEITE